MVEEEFYNAVRHRTILAKHDAPSGLRTAVLSRIVVFSSQSAHQIKERNRLRGTFTRDTSFYSLTGYKLPCSSKTCLPQATFSRDVFTPQRRHSDPASGRQFLENENWPTACIAVNRMY